MLIPMTSRGQRRAGGGLREGRQIFCKHARVMIRHGCRGRSDGVSRTPPQTSSPFPRLPSTPRPTAAPQQRPPQVPRPLASGMFPRALSVGPKVTGNGDQAELRNQDQDPQTRRQTKTSEMSSFEDKEKDKISARHRLCVCTCVYLCIPTCNCVYLCVCGEGV